MFDVGFAEIFLLSLIGLLVLGPERLPGVARTVGGFVRKARTSWASLRSTIESELAEADLTAPIKKAGEEFRQIGKDLTEASALNSKNPTPEAKETDPELSETSKLDVPEEPGDEKPEND